MKDLVLHPLTPHDAATLVTFPAPAAASALHLAKNQAGQLAVTPAAETEADAAPVAELFLQTSANGPLCHVVARDPALRIDGLVPLPLAALNPGSLLHVGAASWFVTTRWYPEPGPAPAELAERKCPVCGGELKLASVVQCVCGRYYHLEKPGADAADQVLNCFLAGPCGLCNRQPTLEPVLTPEPPDKLLDVVSAE